MKFTHFLEYLVNQQDDSPLYLFESSFHKKERAPELLKYFEVPKYFRNDLMPIVPDGNTGWRESQTTI
jgi:histone arginine demethylase JMJD6